MQVKTALSLLLMLGFALVWTAANAGDLGSCLTSMGITQGDVPDAQSAADLWPLVARETDHIDTLWWTGSIEQHIFAGQTLSWQPDLPQMTGVLMQIKYGLWNSPDVYLDIRVNSQLIGTLVANVGYISPGPRYALANISNYIVAGSDLIEITAQPGGGEAVIGYVGVGVRTAQELDGRDLTPLPAADYSLAGPVPNPFNPTTTIRYQLPEISYVHLQIYDTAGRLVATLVNGWREAGRHEVAFDGSNLPSGIYLARLAAGDYKTVQKLVLTR